MELRYVVLTIIKILISVPTVLFYHCAVDGAVLMGGHLDNIHASSNLTIHNSTANTTSEPNSEEIPDPSPLVLPGYNLPENIFNKGKPFYLEKDPLTGKIDFDSQAASVRLDDEMYDYVEEEPSSDIYDKANIDRKDGSLGSHRPSDINQLTPNFHDFLNLPVKYNSDKYVYPLISSSYANTKIQGNVNKYHNHKDYNVKTSTFKSTESPTYYSSHSYFGGKTETTSTTTSTTTTTTPRSTTPYITTTPRNIMTDLKHPSFMEDFEEYYDETEKPSQGYQTTKNVDHIYLTTKAPSTTTKRVLSVFEQLFGDYEEYITTQKPKTTSSASTTTTTEKVQIKESTTSSTTPLYSNSHSAPNVLSGSNMGVDSSYEYEDYETLDHDDNIPVETKPQEIINVSPSTVTTTTTSITEPSTTKMTTEKKFVTPVPSVEPPKVTSLPLGENHISNLNNHQNIIVATQNIREKLHSEIVPKPFGLDKNSPPSTSNIHIAPDQDMVSFVVGHHQNVDGGPYVGVGTSLKESPYDSNPFRPLFGQQAQYSDDSVSYHAEVYKPVPPPLPASAVTIQPQRNSEAALAIGVPINSLQVPGQVVDEKLELEEPPVPKGTGNKIVFPDKKPQLGSLGPPPNREVLQLSSKPMYHQLPSDLTPPKEQEITRPRPPWDPRPGHFYSGKPEYVRPPRPPPETAYKRIDNLPNILPQFRPNMKLGNPPPYLNRQALLERPSNRPVGFFEKLQPPPPPKNLHQLRKIPPPMNQMNQNRPIEDRMNQLNQNRPMDERMNQMHQNRPMDERMNQMHQNRPMDDRMNQMNQNRPMEERSDMKKMEQFGFFQSPPKVIANRRIADLEGDVETLQMIQKKEEKKEEEKNKTMTDKPLYVVYPVNTSPVKMDVIEGNKKESVVIGTRAELPLPPSKINQKIDYEQNPILNPKDRNDAPVLRPHARPTFPIKSDFPYPLERPDSSILAVPEVPTHTSNNLEVDFVSNNQWNSVGENLESRVVNSGGSNQISATLKTFTDKPIAVAYTPTEPHHDKYSMPNYGSPVIPEIRPGTVDTVKTHGNPDNEFTVSAVMHTHPQLEVAPKIKHKEVVNHKSDESPVIHKLEFQAPFQASVNLDSMSQGWSVVKDRSKATTEIGEEVTTVPLATTSEFDIENFKPQLIGGFKPIYNFPEDEEKVKEAEVGERAE